MRVFVVLAALVAVCVAEHCRMTSDCDAANCSGDTMPMCTDTHICTCVPNMMTTTSAPMRMCQMAVDCAHMHLNGHCARDRIHCVDGHCRCVHL